MSTRRSQPCRNQDCSSFWPRSCCQFFSSIKFHSTFPQRPAQVPTLVMPARIVSIASTAPRKAGNAAFVSKGFVLQHFKKTVLLDSLLLISFSFEHRLDKL